MERISVIGLGKLGACYAAFYAERGFTVIGTDKDSKKVALLKKGRAPVSEPSLQEIITKERKRIAVANTTEEAVLKSDVTFVIVPTPSQKNGAFSLAPTLTAMKEIGRAIKKKKKYHLVVLVSTVLPEDSRTAIIPALEKASGKKCGVDFGYCYSPSLIAIGEIIKNLRKPDFIFIGAFDKKSGDLLEKVYRQAQPNVPYEHMSIESAELAKISLNSYVTMKITFANLLGEISDTLPFADVDEITNAIGKDTRIGARYLKSGLGYGGPCFPRDNFAFSYMAARRNITTPLAIHTHTINEGGPKRLAARIKAIAKGKKHSVGVIGIGYKPNTSVVQDSHAVKIVEELFSGVHPVMIFDFLGFDEAEKIFRKRATYASSLEELLDKNSILLLSHPEPRLQDLPARMGNLIGKILIDPWGMFEKEAFPEGIQYVPLGRK